MENAKAIGFHVTGRVQGVWFRAFTQKTATGLGLGGWVRNLPDGSVEGYAEGPAAKIEALVEALHAGPPAAIVAAVEVSPAEPTGAPGFRVR